MALFGKDKVNKGVKGSKGTEESNVLDLVKETSGENTSIALQSDTGRAPQVLHRYHLSEKSNAFAATGRYVFKVAKTANKIEVKKAVESVYGVHVTDVNTLNVWGKNRRQGRTTGRTQNWKKAIVTLKAGERIAGLSEGV